MSNREPVAGDLIIVDWGDAWGRAGWIARDEVKKANTPWPCRTVGWVVDNDKHSIAVSMCSSALTPDEREDGEVGPVFCIPKGMILKVQFVEEVS